MAEVVVFVFLVFIVVLVALNFWLRHTNNMKLKDIEESYRKNKRWPK